ncbi:hypothetical protein N865_02490 [Intrasporangium oryzae NRRL B-24470]|uniref:Uncharacterized protein n=1 Tax=Intrasporangium oryzae NRRL B-24470 TaxID=1386089 RepID=W9GFH8_9MICO|nr:hypothetical protein [Intrasporangium oryzae]EWT02619.1 hypothetical protein N865_02490 [Intrasporangium oryzae NRRL B-24470]
MVRLIADVSGFHSQALTVLTWPVMSPGVVEVEVFCVPSLAHRWRNPGLEASVGPLIPLGLGALQGLIVEVVTEGDPIVGASGWSYRTPFMGSVQESFLAVQRQILESGDYIWPWDDFDPAETDAEGFARPASLDQLAAAKQTEDFWEKGTHTMLDLDRVSEADDPDELGAARALSDAEMTEVLGTDQPTSEDLARVHDPAGDRPLEDLIGPKWSGRSLLVYQNDAPSEVFFWGWSGD